LNQQDEQLLDLIDSYLNNSMSEGERSAFEEKMASNKDLAAKINEVRATNEAIYYASLAELKKTIAQDVKTIKYKPSSNWRKATYISAGALILLSGAATYFVTNNTKSQSDSKHPSTHSIKETENNYLDENNGTVVQQNPQHINKSLPLPSSGNREVKDSILSDNKATHEPALSETNNQKIIEQPQATGTETKANTKKDSLSSTERKAAPVVNEAKVICNKSFNITTEASCKRQETGSIIVTTDGAYKYTFQVNNYSTSGSRGLFENMPTGDYDVVVTYGKECVFTKKTTVTEKWCAMNSSFSFNPDYNEKWVLKYEPGTSGTFTIFDKAGKEVYNNTFGSGNEEWNGTDKNGGIVPMGIYVAVIDYSNGHKERVELTIVR